MAARAIWTGVITFGMVSIPVKLFSATENKDISFNQLHKDCMSRIKEQKFCPTCERKIETDEIEKGYEYAKGQYVVITKDDLEKLPLPNKNIVEITAFVKQEDIDPVYYDKSYYLEPEEKAQKPFALFMRAITDKGMTAVASVSLRNKQRLCALRPLDGTLMMSTLLYPDEIRVEKGKALPNITVSPAELTMAGTLIDMMSQEFHPENYTDNYREAVLTIIDAKLQGKEVADLPQPATGKVIDLMEALQASMESLKSKKPGSAAQAPAALPAVTAQAESESPEDEVSAAGAAKGARTKKKAATG